MLTWRMIGQWVRTSRILAPATLVAWLLLVAFSALSAGAPASPHAMLLMAGGYGLAAWLLLAILLVPLSFLIKEPPEPTRLDGASLAALGLTALVGGVALRPLQPVLWDLIPSGIAYPDELSRAASFYGALALGALVTWIVWRSRASTKARPYPFWTFALLYCVARTGATADLALVAPGREGLFDAALLFVLGVAALGPASKLSAKPIRVLAALFVLSVAALLATLGSSTRARAELFATYPGSASLVHHVRGLLDLDGDGFAGVLGGTDCDDLDDRVFPLALEIAGDGVDQNCNGVDAELSVSRGPELAAQARPEATKRSVVLLTVDTVRADLLTAAVMPRLTAFAARSAVFTRSYAAAPYTAASLSSVLTGHTSMSHALRWEESIGLEPTVTELLREVGYSTAIVMYDWWHTGKTWDIHKGFERVLTLTAAQHDAYRTVTGPRITDGALQEIARLTAQPKPFFLWLHFLDPHAEYVPREHTPFSSKHDLRSRYWQEVWATDREIGRVLDALEAARFFEQGMLVVHSDHGELVEDRGRTGHAYWLDEEVLRTLLVVHGPDVPAGRYDTRVRLFDVAPTILDFAAGVTATSWGRTMRPVLERRELEDRDALVHSVYQGESESAILSGNDKLIVNHMLGTLELYDLAKDPDERHNLVDERPGIASALARRLAEVSDLERNDIVLRQREERPLVALCSAGVQHACMALEQAERARTANAGRAGAQ